MPSYQRFSSGSVSSGGTSARLTASTNARKTVRATKEILNIEDEDEEEGHSPGFCGGVTSTLGPTRRPRHQVQDPSAD